ncbi:putative uncharacterized protein [Waddlia chondrophila 2032/99]|uniref:Uncharacterized protein n=3 Tax=Waddlia chondrophila TaxID=71667 RepID=D6YTP0_WADCW|nr:hypothetical protein wcw_0126 [Waddlia chondrophila WSU 86-1044]CCB90484.1 putative uncharacterized protein [Waddlia chondrophila 2032/99]
MILSMKTVTSYLLLICLLPVLSWAEQKVSFHQISKTINNEKIEISGYIYQSENGEAYLAPQPDLKSCCIGSRQRSGEQIVLKDLESIPATKQPVTMRGTLRIDPETGQMFLTEGEAVPKENRLHLLFAAAAVGTAIFFFLLRKRI